MARFKPVEELSDEFKAAVAKEADRIGRKTGSASSNVLAKNVDFLFQLISDDVLSVWLEDMQTETRKLQQYVEEVHEEVEEKVGSFKLLESATETLSPDYMQIVNFYQQLVNVGLSTEPERGHFETVSKNVVLREAAYIVWAALMRDGSTPPTDPNVKNDMGGVDYATYKQ